jgi:hypothetical protein
MSMCFSKDSSNRKDRARNLLNLTFSCTCWQVFVGVNKLVVPRCSGLDEYDRNGALLFLLYVSNDFWL